MAEMLSAEKIKKEPTDDETGLQLSTAAAVVSLSPPVSTHLPSSSPSASASSSSRVLSSRPVGSSSSGPKTILLVQAVSKTSASAATASSGGIQSRLIPTSMRTVSTSNSARLNNNMSMSRLATDSLTVTPARLGVRVVSVPSPSSIPSTGVSPGQIDIQTAYGLVFNSRTIQADGTVCTSKEYLCNFCQFKVSSAAALLEHSSTHLFSCSQCSFRSTSRLESLIHKRESHPSTADELAGFEDLDRPTLVLKTARVPRLGTAAFLSPSSTGARLGASSLMTHLPRTVGMPVLSTVSSSTRPVPSSACTPSSSSNVVRTMSGKTGDSYFTYRIAHDVDGRVQAYECDACGFRSVHISEMFTHASTHSLADLAKSGAAAVSNVVWECFYCSFSAPLQATVVSHVIASHPSQPIQLKRLPTTTSAAVTGASDTAEEPPAGSSKIVSVSSELSPLPVEQPSPNKTGPTPPTMAADVSASAKPAVAKPVDVKVEKKKKSDASDEGCIWGCYYCTMQSASRNDIIGHLKKQHSSEKLVVTRRRITHVVTGGTSAGGKPATAVGPSSDKNSLQSHTAEMTPTSRPEVGSVESSCMGSHDDDKVGTSGKSRKRQLSLSSDHLQPSSAASADNGESGDGNQPVGGAASAKSRRKQMAPRRVADELAAAAAADEPSANDNASLTVGEAVSDSAINSDALPMVTHAAATASSGRSLLTTSSGSRRHGRSSTSKYDNLIKKLKMAESEDSGMEIASLLNKPRVEEPPKTRSSQGKALSLLTGQLVSGYVQPPNGIPTISSAPSRDLPPPMINRESSPPKSSPSGQQSSGLKVEVVQYVEKKMEDRSRCYVYDSERMTARCGVCGTTTRGLDVVRQIHEHVAAHFNECRWACAYCTFQCSRCTAIVGHVSKQHRGQPLRIIRRRPHRGSRNKTANDSTPKQRQVSDKFTVNIRATATQKLRGPRCSRDLRHISSTSVMWQCAFCSRRSLFRGLIAIHMKLAHFDHSDDLRAVPQRWIRPPVSTDIASPEVDLKRGQVTLVRIEDVDHYLALSDVILSNGTDLIRELDADDEADVVENTSDGSGSDAAEFRCTHCHFRGVTPAVVKCHILQAHRLEDVTVLDLRSSRRQNHEHLLMCHSVECQFVSSIEKDFRAHIGAHPSHSTCSVASPSHSGSRPAECPRRTPPPSKSLLSPPQSKSVQSMMMDTPPVSSAPARTVVASGTKNRRGTDGPIEYNDDGTMKGLDLGGRSTAMRMQCTHCCTVMSCDVGEMRSHLASAHPRLVPLAIDVECADRSQPTSLFLCLVCDFAASYYNVYKHHMDEEHPDSESGSRYQRPGATAAKRHSAPAGKQDRSSTANVRRPRRPAAILNSSVDNGHHSPSVSSDDVAGLAAADDADNPPVSRKSSSHNAQYSSQEFDFSRRYKCVLCSHAAATLVDMKLHLTSRHDSTSAHQCIDRRARQLRKRQGIYFCPDAKCAFCCKFDDELANHVDQEHPSLVSAAGPPPTKSSQSDDSGCAGDRVYQCAHCTYITTDLRNVRVHVIAEHATTEGGFAEIKTAVSSDGSLIMNVNDAVSTKSSTAGDRKSVLENGENLGKNGGSSVKVDDEGKVFAVL